jgi:hypothetical protein
MVVGSTPSCAATSAGVKYSRTGCTVVTEEDFGATRCSLEFPRKASCARALISPHASDWLREGWLLGLCKQATSISGDFRHRNHRIRFFEIRLGDFQPLSKSVLSFAESALRRVGFSCERMMAYVAREVQIPASRGDSSTCTTAFSCDTSQLSAANGGATSGSTASGPRLRRCDTGQLLSFFFRRHDFVGPFQPALGFGGKLLNLLFGSR